MHKLTIATLFLATGCFANNGPGWNVSESEPAAVEPEATTEDEAAPAVPAPKSRANEPFVVHEWGTYTSLQGSDGRVQDGMHYEEEALPAFVYGRTPPPPPGMPSTKRVEDLLLEGITQKLETPVIYFYGAPAEVSVTVDFPRGVISQWYPNATSFAPQVYDGAFDPDAILEGTMTWDLEVLGYGEDEGIVEVPADDVWAPSREVGAQPVRFGDEVEKFIFYRGLGRFDTPFRVTSEGRDLTLHNGSDETIPDAWVLHWNGERGAVWELGAIEGGDAVGFVPTPKELPQPDYLLRAREAVAGGLIRSGLTEDEAWAMVNTWDRSYFRTDGLRVLYVAPRAWTDELLPIEVTPKPDELVRTLVGRVEVMTEAEENELLRRLEAGELDASELGRFGEPRLQRLLELTEDPAARSALLSSIVALRGTQ